MAIPVSLRLYNLEGLSTDTKPNLPDMSTGSTFTETDTGNLFTYDRKQGAWIKNNNSNTGFNPSKATTIGIFEIKKTSSLPDVDVYTITYTNGAETTFDVPKGSKIIPNPETVGTEPLLNSMEFDGNKFRLGGNINIEAGNGIIVTTGADNAKVISIDESTVANKHNYYDKTTIDGITEGLTEDIAIKANISDLREYTKTEDLATIALTGSYDDLDNKPDLSVYETKAEAFSGSYNDLTDKPTLFSGDYDDLTNKPTIPVVPANVSAFTNDAGYITGINSSDVTTALGYTPGTSDFSGNYDDLTNKPDLSVYTESADLATVATTGSYSDLTGTPTIVANPELAGTESELTGLQVGETKYKVSQGGSSTKYLHTINAYANFYCVDGHTTFTFFSNSNMPITIEQLFDYLNTNRDIQITTYVADDENFSLTEIGLGYNEDLEMVSWGDRGINDINIFYDVVSLNLDI